MRDISWGVVAPWSSSSNKIRVAKVHREIHEECRQASLFNVVLDHREVLGLGIFSNHHVLLVSLCTSST